MSTFVRFETPYHCESSRQPLGIFWAAATIEERADLPKWAREWLLNRGYWFGAHLPVPRLANFDQRAIFWFRPQSKIVREMWHLVSVLKEEGVAVALRWTRSSGRIVYDDSLQIAAVPFTRGRRDRRRRLPQLV
jgi:hypothetical protein